MACRLVGAKPLPEPMLEYCKYYMALNTLKCDPCCAHKHNLTITIFPVQLKMNFINTLLTCLAVNQKHLI